jgi:hypothetical protein
MKLNWSNILRQILQGAAAGFLQSEASNPTGLKQSGVFAGIGAVAGFMNGLTTHPAVVAATAASVATDPATPPTNLTFIR